PMTLTGRTLLMGPWASRKRHRRTRRLRGLPRLTAFLPCAPRGGCRSFSYCAWALYNVIFYVETSAAWKFYVEIMKQATLERAPVGRPPKFREPSGPVTVTLPNRTLAQLRRIDADRAKAIVKAV